MARVIRVDRGLGGVGFQMLGGIRLHLMRNVTGIILDLFGVRMKVVFYPGMHGRSLFNHWNESPPWNDIMIERGPFRVIVGRAYSGYLTDG